MRRWNCAVCPKKTHILNECPVCLHSHTDSIKLVTITPKLRTERASSAHSLEDRVSICVASLYVEIMAPLITALRSYVRILAHLVLNKAIYMCSKAVPLATLDICHVGTREFLLNTL